MSMTPRVYNNVSFSETFSLFSFLLLPLLQKQKNFSTCSFSDFLSSANEIFSCFPLPFSFPLLTNGIFLQIFFSFSFSVLPLFHKQNDLVLQIFSCLSFFILLLLCRPNIFFCKYIPPFPSLFFLV